ncbi:hypothetical protein lbkm_0993 [Lachnospiraceae bacterium KM106-2]|nr:hypothetical protein lbkm_0993 [Lachnospiraceae bacterium KM106-2]
MYKKSLKLLFGIFTAIGTAMVILGVVLYFVFGSAAGQLKDSFGSDIGVNVNLFMLLVTGGIGVIFLLIGVIGLMVTNKKEKMKRKLKETGRAIYASILTVEQNRNIIINGRCPYQIIAQYVDESTKTIYQYKSEYISEYPSYAKEGENVRIYIDPENKKKYFMDVESLSQMTGYKVEKL